MKLYNTKNISQIVDFKTAVFNGLAEQGGLFMPVSIPKLPNSFFSSLKNRTLHDISFEVCTAILDHAISKNSVEKIVAETLNFDIPLVPIDKTTLSLELFHGPTLAFKDVGARFLARVISYFAEFISKKIFVLVATSGDTGSAVGHGFLNVDGIEVILLYPSGRVSKIQEQQLTTIGRNVSAIEVDGTFDDCQHLVKTALSDANLNEKLLITSANSINIARIIPQMFYYFWGYKQLNDVATTNSEIIFSVPSGNFGNLTAGLFARKMGLPIDRFIAATNKNDTFPEFLQTGIFSPRPSVTTISNAMDVGNPNNFPRIQALYPNLKSMQELIWSVSISEESTKKSMLRTFLENKYLLDPHGAVGLEGLRRYMSQIGKKNAIGVVLETAHPAKFLDTVSEVVRTSIELPLPLEQALNMSKHASSIPNHYDDLSSFILEKA